MIKHMEEKIIISFSEAMEEAMEKLIANKDLMLETRADVIRNSFVLYKYIIDEIEHGNRIIIADNNNTIIKEIVMADTFRKLEDKFTGAGGVKCGCCNWTKEGMSHSRRKIKRLKQALKGKIRTYLKKELDKEEKE